MPRHKRMKRRLIDCPLCRRPMSPNARMCMSCRKAGRTVQPAPPPPPPLLSILWPLERVRVPFPPVCAHAPRDIRGVLHVDQEGGTHA